MKIWRVLVEWVASEQANSAAPGELLDDAWFFLIIILFYFFKLFFFPPRNCYIDFPVRPPSLCVMRALSMVPLGCWEALLSAAFRSLREKVRVSFPFQGPMLPFKKKQKSIVADSFFPSC